ncbi:MAG TPA: methyltransferase [Gaiellaceae bacterium]|nr:methyltransferase [Gaiellaceae bacterium]
MPEIPSLGRRGEGWVVLQFVLIGVLVAVCISGPRWPDEAGRSLLVVGALVAVAGAVVVAAAVRALGRSLTPFPKPPRGGRLVVDGPYRVVRHPIYSGGILVSAGLSFALSPLALAVTALLAVVWALKSSVEERYLGAAYREYELYCARTRFRLVPFVF